MAHPGSFRELLAEPGWSQSPTPNPGVYFVLCFISESASPLLLLSHVRLFAPPWTAVHQDSLSFTVTQSLLKFIVLVMPSNHFVLCRPLLLLPSIFPNIRVFSNESTHCPSLVLAAVISPLNFSAVHGSP